MLISAQGFVWWGIGVIGTFTSSLHLTALVLLWFQLLKAPGREGNLIAIFQEEHSQVLQQLQAFTFFPESQAVPRKPFERKTMERQSARRQPLSALVSHTCTPCEGSLVSWNNLSHLPCSSAAQLCPAVR